MLAEHLSDWLRLLGASLSAKTIAGTGGIYVRLENATWEYPQNPSSQQTTESVTEYFEGNPIEVRQTKYERDSKARAACLKHHGYSCKACSLNFEQRYGLIGREYIHVHHIEPLSSIRATRKVDPIKDLVPLCPNCHAMIHKLPSPQTLEVLRGHLR